MSSASTPWRKAEPRISTEQSYYETVERRHHGGRTGQPMRVFAVLLVTAQLPTGDAESRHLLVPARRSVRAQ
jgi:hypothetical protein